MSARVEWMPATLASVDLFPSGTDDWVGSAQQDPGSYVLTLSVDEVTAIEGTLSEIRDLVARINATVAAAVEAVTVEGSRVRVTRERTARRITARVVAGTELDEHVRIDATGTVTGSVGEWDHVAVRLDDSQTDVWILPDDLAPES